MGTQRGQSVGGAVCAPSGFEQSEQNLIKRGIRPEDHPARSSVSHHTDNRFLITQFQSCISTRRGSRKPGSGFYAIRDRHVLGLAL